MTYGAAGVSFFHDRFKVRVARDISRVNVLSRNGHTHIDMETLPRSMNKAEIAEWLGSADTWPAEARTAIEKFQLKHRA